MVRTDMEVYEQDENKLSTVPELSELTDTPTPPTHNRSNGYRDESISGSVQSNDSNENERSEVVPSISAKISEQEDSNNLQADQSEDVEEIARRYSSPILQESSSRRRIISTSLDRGCNESDD